MKKKKKTNKKPNFENYFTNVHNNKMIRRHDRNK